ncbi:hypothetical protein MIND_00554800 [Mycena indigotica]|uniref:Uncharacterized protein n=1 Tax=Mycena indigotica TaxID=2126181 RepID=A0A8H6SYF5_9AGAR|nr:uncharacterized protein MIND_00554800 [Mycena indigotica]KAF7307598.1 hypothetical protein MIND_00554800 [Mycena indigotica]
MLAMEPFKSRMSVVWVASILFQIHSSMGAAIPSSEARLKVFNEKRAGDQARGMGIADVVIVGLLLVLIPLTIALILRWRAGRLARDRSPPKELESNDCTQILDPYSSSDDGSVDLEPQQRASWALFIGSKDENALSRSNTATTRQLYVSNQARRAQQKAIELERQRESVDTGSKASTGARVSTASSRTAATLVDGSRPSSVMWTKEGAPPVPPVALRL